MEASALIIVVALALLFTVGAWLDRNPCPHTHVVRLDDRDSVCLDCDSLLLTEDVDR